MKPMPTYALLGALLIGLAASPSGAERNSASDDSPSRVALLAHYGQLHLNQTNITGFDKYLTASDKLEEAIKAAFEKEQRLRKG